MKKAKEEMLTVKEWAKRAGLELDNYDGFTDIYEKLSGNSSNDFETNVMTRFRDVGELVCTRQAFESRLLDCTMTIPQKSEYLQMAEVIPNFVESNICFTIASISGFLRHKMYKSETELKEMLKELLDLLKLKASVREKNIQNNSIKEEVDISDLKADYLSPEEVDIIKAHQGTIESLEVRLSDESIQSIEILLEKENIDLSEIPLQKIDVLDVLSSFAGRKKSDSKEEFFYVSSPYEKKADFEMSYTITGSEGMHTGTVFDAEIDNARIRGVIPNPLSQKAATEAMQILDSDVTQAERKGLAMILRDFIKKIKGKNDKEKER